MLAWQAYRNGQTEAVFAPDKVAPLRLKRAA